MTLTLCTCTVLTGGTLYISPTCPVHVGRSIAAIAAGESDFDKKTHAEGRTLLRVAKELRAFLAEAPADDPEAQSLLQDCDTLERVGHWLSTSNAVTFR